MHYDFQILIFKLYTDKTERDIFFTDPKRIFRKYDLAEKEKKALLGIPRANLEKFAQNLSDKRKMIAERILEKNLGAVIGSDFYESGPVIFFADGEIKTERLNDSAYLTLKDNRGEINLKTILSAGSCKLAGIVLLNDLMGKKIFYL